MARSVPLGRVQLLLATVLCLAGLQGCDWFKKKEDFYGVVKNRKDLRIYSWHPGKQSEVHQLDPNEMFYCTLKGSEKYEFKAWLNDGTVVGKFTGRINQVEDDTTIDDMQIDWAWVVGGKFYACASPKPGVMAPAASAIVLEATEGGSNATPEVVMVSSIELDQLRRSSTIAELDRVIRTIDRVRGFAPDSRR